MTNFADESEAFDADVVTVVADDDLDAPTLSDLIARHQEAMAALPGIENLAYEWRKQYESPLIERTEAAYYFAVPEWVWEEFADALDVGTPERDALAEVHRRTVAARTAAAPEPAGSTTYVVLDRAVDDRAADTS